MSLARTWTETKRELGRATGPWTLAGGLALASGFALFALAEAGTDAYALATYVFVPMLMCPLAAQRVAGDRERGLAAVHATSPATRADLLVGRLAGLSILLVAGLALTVPLLYASTETVAPGAFRAALPLVVWGLLVGTVSLLAGLAVGYATPGASSGALSVGFGLVLAWFFVAVQRHRFLAWADGETERAAIQAVLHANPMTWALEAEDPAAVGVVANHADFAVGLAVLLVPLGLGLAAVALGLQHADGWVERPLRHPLAVTLLAAAVLGGAGLLATWDYAQPAPPPDASSQADRGQAGDLQVRLEADAQGAWRATTPLAVELSVYGPPNATVAVDDLALSMPHGTVRHDLETPTTVALDEVHDGRGRYAPEGSTYGTGRLTVDASATPHRLVTLVPLTAELTLDGNATTLATDVSAFGWRTPTLAPLVAGGAPLAALALAAALLPRRLNRW